MAALQTSRPLPQHGDSAAVPTHGRVDADAATPLAAAVAHDINNLLMVIARSCDELRQDLAPGQRDALEHIAAAAGHATSLVKQMLAVSRDTVLEPQVFDVHADLRRMHGLLQRIVGPGVAVQMELSPLESAPVRMRDGDLVRIVTNLATNARDAMPHGGTLRVSTLCARAEDGSSEPGHPRRWLQLDVRDNGVGMTHEVRDRIFERFFTTKPEGRGMGHGLASVQRTVLDCGGTIDVWSEPGQGAHFIVRLPLVDAPAAHDASAPAPSARTGERVLIVEDEPLARDLIASGLRRLGYEAAEASSAHDALDFAQQEPRFALLLTDVTMPDMDGTELARRFRSLSPLTRVLFVSGDTGDPSYAAERARNPMRFLQKPFDAATLARRVRAILDSAD